MEKILLGAYISILAAFITAAASIVKLVNEKESKTTDYRQSWTESVRVSLSQLIASITLQANYLVNREEITVRLNSAHATKPKEHQQQQKNSLVAYLQDELSALNKSIRENRQCIQQNYALTALHFKPHDEVFIKIENKFEQANQFLSELAKLTGNHETSDREILREKIGKVVNDITETARHILKTEWEHVKKGEPAYKTTKNWSQYIGIAAFSILFLWGIFMFAVSVSSPSMAPSHNLAIKPAILPEEKREIDKEKIELNQNFTVQSPTCTFSDSAKENIKRQGLNLQTEQSSILERRSPAKQVGSPNCVNER